MAEIVWVHNQVNWGSNPYASQLSKSIYDCVLSLLCIYCAKQAKAKYLL